MGNLQDVVKKFQITHIFITFAIYNLSLMCDQNKFTTLFNILLTDKGTFVKLCQIKERFMYQKSKCLTSFKF